MLYRELRDSDQMNSGDHINYGKRLLTQIVGLQVFLTNVLSPMSRGEWPDAEQYEEIMRQVKAKKHRWAQEILAEQPPTQTNKTNRDHSLEGVSVAEARSVSRLCVKARRPLRGGRCPALTQTAAASAFWLRLSGNGSKR